MLIERFLNEKVNRNGKDLDTDTKRAYTYDIEQFLEYVGKEENDITLDDVSAWFGHYRHEYSTASMSRKVMALKSYFKFLNGIGKVEINPMKNFQTFKPKSKEKKPLTSDQINDMISCSKNERDKAIIEVLSSTGLRVSELINLKVSDMDSDEITIHGKGDKDRTIFLNDKVRSSIRDYMDIRHETDIDNLFVSNQGSKMCEKNINAMLKNIAKRADIEDWENVSPHLFRATYATLLAQKNIPVPTIQKILGHSRIATTMIYIKTPQSQIRNAMDVNVF